MQPFAALVIIIFTACLTGFFGEFLAWTAFGLLACFTIDCVTQHIRYNKHKHSKE